VDTILTNNIKIETIRELIDPMERTKPQQNQITDAALAANLAYWEENLRGVPELLALPTDMGQESFGNFFRKRAATDISLTNK
jgi:hypothetical protein